MYLVIYGPLTAEPLLQAANDLRLFCLVQTFLRLSHLDQPLSMLVQGVRHALEELLPAVLWSFHQ